jgi:hypothetical protein
VEIISFEDAKARRQSKGEVTEHLLEADKEIREMQRQYREYAQFCNRWYDEHVVRKDGNGGWIYKEL